MSTKPTPKKASTKPRFVDNKLLDLSIFGLFAVLISALVATIVPQGHYFDTSDPSRKEGIVNGVFSNRDKKFLAAVHPLVPADVRAVTTDTDIILLGKALALDIHSNGTPTEALKDMLAVNGFTDSKAKEFLRIVDETY